MPELRCPHCSILLREHEARGATCPACNGLLTHRAVTSAPPKSRAGGTAPWLGLVVFGGILLLGVAALVGYMAWPRTKPVDPGDYQAVADGRNTGNEKPSTLPLPKTEEASASLLDAPSVERVEPEPEGREVLPPPLTDAVEAVRTPVEADDRREMLPPPLVEKDS